MRILMTTDTVGGVWRFTQELASGLLEEGCDVALVSFGGLPARMQRSWVELMEGRWPENFEFTATDYPLEWMQNNESAYYEAALLLHTLANRFDADILHANQFSFGALLTTVPKVITAHSDVLSWAASCRGQSLEPSAWLDRYCTLVSAGLSGAHAVVAPTHWMLGALRANFGVPQIQSVIPNGRCIEHGPGRARKLQAVTAGRLWDEAKNVVMVADVSSPIPIFAAGATSCESVEVSSLSGFHLLGYLSEEELLSLFHNSAIYICTSKYEPFGLAPLEAALCGCAVLANDIPSLREVWQDAALYFSDAASLTALLDELRRDPSLLAARQDCSLKRARTFSRQKMTKAYLALFRDAISQANQKGMADVA